MQTYKTAAILTWYTLSDLLVLCNPFASGLNNWSSNLERVTFTEYFSRVFLGICFSKLFLYYQDISNCVRSCLHTRCQSVKSFVLGIVMHSKSFIEWFYLEVVMELLMFCDEKVHFKNLSMKP